MAKKMSKKERRIYEAWQALSEAPGMDDESDGVFWQRIADAAECESWEVCCWCADFPELSGFTETKPEVKPTP